MNINRTPEKIGQICKIESDIADFESDKVYYIEAVIIYPHFITKLEIFSLALLQGKF